MSIVVEVERQIGQPRLWDFALDHGPRCINCLRNLVRVITFPPHALSACPQCEEENVPRDSFFRMFSTVIQEASTTATIFYHYFHQSLTLTQFCLTISIPWPTYSELPFLIIYIYIYLFFFFSLLIITCFSCMPMPYGSCNI